MKLRATPGIIICLFIVLKGHLAAGQEAGDTTGKKDCCDKDAQTFLYYALLGPENIKKDTIFLEKDVYIYKNKVNKQLFFKKKDQPPFHIPASAYNDLSAYIFTNFLPTDAYKILERMASMNGLLKNARLGMDIASHQSGVPINWAKVKKDTVNAPIRFVFIRSTLGYNNNFDPKLEEHYKAASSNGYTVGFYHNFVLNKTRRQDFVQHAKDQAYKFVEAYKNRNIPVKPILDIEVHPTYAVVENQFTPAEVREATKAFVDIVEKELKTDLIIYTFESFYNTYLKGYYDTRYVWIARYPHTPEFGDRQMYPGAKNPYLGISYDFNKEEFNYTLKNRSIGWQFSEDGHVDGISNKVDLNIILEKDYPKWLRGQ